MDFEMSQTIDTQITDSDASEFSVNIENLEQIEPIVEFTENAQKQLVKLLQRRGMPDSVIRIGVRGGGCSGLSYVLKPDTDLDETDVTWCLTNQIRIVIDPRSIKYLSGTTIDYDIRNLMEGGFKYNNPNSVRSCGCGTSFTPK